MSKKQKVKKLNKDEVLDNDDDCVQKPEFVSVDDLRQSDTFKNLFPRNPAILDQIEKDMRDNDFEASHPLVTWNYTIVDGNCRFEIAKKLGLTGVWIVDYGWETEEEALEYAIFCQRSRRNMTDGDIISLVEKLDQLKKPGRKPDSVKLASEKADIGKSAAKTAKALGTSTTNVEKTRKILKSGNPELIQAVKSGEKSIHQGSQEIAASKPAKAKRKHKAGPDYKGVLKALNQAIECCDSDKDLTETITKVIEKVNSKIKEQAVANTAKAK